jgi:EAL domain-containing protein (putative c-di-GMP-specific phosphodiesterase class I)
MIYSKKFDVGEEIFRFGDRGRNAYFIERGNVEISVIRDKKNVVIAKLGKGEIFGEMSMIDDAPRSATVTAVSDTEVIVIQRSRFLKPLESADPMMNLILRIVLARLRHAQHQLSGMASAPGDIDANLDEIRALAFKRISFEKRMLQGLDDQEFVMHYQPIIALEGGHIAGFEALMRWYKSDGSMVSPVEFIPLAEETGLIGDLGRIAMRDGLGQQLRFADEFAKVFPDLEPPFMSINVSGMQLADFDEIDRLAEMINESGADPAYIKLEITETLMVKNFAHATEALNRLKDIGVSIAIDDFGTGYSSLSYLHQFPLDTLKIDRAFVASMDTSSSSRRIVLSIAQLAHSLDMVIVAEGIEERAQMDALRALGCQYGQGYYMSKPMAADDIVELIKTRPSW